MASGGQASRTTVNVPECKTGLRPVVKPAENPKLSAESLAFNLKTANALGVTIPPAILGRADEVIE